ncbi:MAG TPA: DUF2007 domain-containing protein [Gammaproteobacteria bacterium]|nr:DUF2007 domain-containing protein [Gammaproteobacteria bacterium]
MKRVYSASNLFSAQIIKDYLQALGIDAFVQGELLMGAIGEIPADTYPSVWISNDEDYEVAKEQIKLYETQNTKDQVYRNVWKCISCDELMEAQFTQCWKCGAIRDSF